MRTLKLMICYVGKDSSLAVSLAKRIEKIDFGEDKLDVTYMDKPGVGCANNWVTWSEENVLSSDIVMQIWTKNTMESVDSIDAINNKVILNELLTAMNNKKQVIVLDNVGEDNYAKGYTLNSYNVSKTFISDFNESFDKIVEVIKDRIYRIIHNDHPTYLVPQKVLISNDSMGSLGERFVGRKKELQEMDEMFAHGKNVVILSGDGGIGKTEIARYYASIKGTKGLYCYKACGDEHNLKLSSIILSLDYENELSDEDKKKSDCEKALIRINECKNVDPRFILIIDNFNSDFDESENKKIINKLTEVVSFKVLI